MSGLLLVCRFFYDAPRVLREILQLTLVCVELFLDGDFVGRSERGYGAKLHVAVFANA